MQNNELNLRILARIAQALAPIQQPIVFVGGAVTSLYVNDAAADDHRMTMDVDLSLEIASSTELEALRLKLLELGFVQSVEDTVPCRFRFEQVQVDVLSTEGVHWAPGNRWFAMGFKQLERVNVLDTWVDILPVAYYLAAKFDAFTDRGQKDPFVSKDLQDIVYIMDFRQHLFDELAQADRSVKAYLQECFCTIRTDSLLQEVVLGNILPHQQMQRFTALMNAIDKFAQAR